MAERVPGGTVNNDFGCSTSHTFSLLDSLSGESNVNGASQACTSSGGSGDPLPCNGATATQSEGEWVEQVDQGVYITVSFSATGGKYLKKVRFRYGHPLAIIIIGK